jgi:hypothetical protein
MAHDLLYWLLFEVPNQGLKWVLAALLDEYLVPNCWHLPQVQVTEADHQAHHTLQYALIKHLCTEGSRSFDKTAVGYKVDVSVTYIQRTVQFEGT